MPCARKSDQIAIDFDWFYPLPLFRGFCVPLYKMGFFFSFCKQNGLNKNKGAPVRGDICLCVLFYSFLFSRLVWSCLFFSMELSCYDAVVLHFAFDLCFWSLLLRLVEILEMFIFIFFVYFHIYFLSLRYGRLLALLLGFYSLLFVLRFQHTQGSFYWFVLCSFQLVFSYLSFSFQLLHSILSLEFCCLFSIDSSSSFMDCQNYACKTKK